MQCTLVSTEVSSPDVVRYMGMETEEGELFVSVHSPCLVNAPHGLLQEPPGWSWVRRGVQGSMRRRPSAAAPVPGVRQRLTQIPSHHGPPPWPESKKKK